MENREKNKKKKLVKFLNIERWSDLILLIILSTSGAFLVPQNN